MRSGARVGSRTERTLRQLALAWLLWLPATDARATGMVPPPPADVTASKAYSALERSCAGCHQQGRLAPGMSAGGGIDNILAMAEIARMPRLVRPALPDASRLYNVALTRERHHDILNDPAEPGPSADEVQAIRDWIVDLPRRDCAQASIPSGRETGRLMAIALADLAPETARLTRFVSIAHLARSCADIAGLERWKQRLATGSQHVVSNDQPAESRASAFVPLDAGRLIWRVSLRDLGRTAADWERLAEAVPARHAPGLSIPSTVLAAIGGGTPLLPANALDLSVADRAADRVGQRRPGDLARLAGELWLEAHEVVRLLSSVPPALQLPARRLTGGDAVDPDDLDRLAAVLSGRPSATTSTQSERFEIALWSDKVVYAAGDTATFRVLASRDCYLTLIGIDRAGRATVLFPSELEPDNRIKAGAIVSVPGAKATYRFRFKDTGREQIVAVCSETHKSPEGIAHDYDRLRFTVLGDWRLFLREPPELKEARRDDAATDVPRPRQRLRRRAIAPDGTSGAQVGPDLQTRTAILIEIQ